MRSCEVPGLARWVDVVCDTIGRVRVMMSGGSERGDEAGSGRVHGTRRTATRGERTGR